MNRQTTTKSVFKMMSCSWMAWCSKNIALYCRVEDQGEIDTHGSWLPMEKETRKLSQVARMAVLSGTSRPQARPQVWFWFIETYSKFTRIQPVILPQFFHEKVSVNILNLILKEMTEGLRKQLELLWYQANIHEKPVSGSSYACDYFKWYARQLP